MNNYPNDLREDEILKPVPNLPGYYATNYGRVWSDKQSGKWLKDSSSGNGYRRVVVINNGKQSWPYVHQMVVWAFYGEIPPKHNINHIDRDVTNNRVENLEVLSVKDHHDKNQIGLKYYGRYVVSPKLTPQDQLNIYNRWVKGETQVSLAAEYNVTQPCISLAVNRVKRQLAV